MVLSTSADGIQLLGNVDNHGGLGETNGGTLKIFHVGEAPGTDTVLTGRLVLRTIC